MVVLVMTCVIAIVLVVLMEKYVSVTYKKMVLVLVKVPIHTQLVHAILGNIILMYIVTLHVMDIMYVHVIMHVINSHVRAMIDVMDMMHVIVITDVMKIHVFVTSRLMDFNVRIVILQIIVVRTLIIIVSVM